MPKPAPDKNSEPEEYADVESTRLTMSLGATVSISTGSDWTDWVKPNVSFSVNFVGIPTDKQIRETAHVIQTTVLEPALDDVLLAEADKLRQLRAGLAPK